MVIVLDYVHPALGRVDMDQFLICLGKAESRMNHAAVEESSGARGAWQMTPAAWEDVSAVLAHQGSATYDHLFAHDPNVGSVYASYFVMLTARRLAERLQREAGAPEIIGAWNMGVEGFARIGFNLDRAPAATRALYNRFMEAQSRN